MKFICFHANNDILNYLRRRSSFKLIQKQLVFSVVREAEWFLTFYFYIFSAFFQNTVESHFTTISMKRELRYYRHFIPPVLFCYVNRSETERRYLESGPRHGDPATVEFIIQEAITFKTYNFSTRHSPFNTDDCNVQSCFFTYYCLPLASNSTRYS